MKFISKIILAMLLLLFFYSCSKKNTEISKIEANDLELQMIDSYKEGLIELEKGDSLLAANKFKEAEALYPQSEWAAKSALMSAYAYYKQDYYSDAIFELERFIKTYPLDIDKDYAHFLLAMCFYEKIVDETKDLEAIRKSKKEFEFIIQNYPNTDYAKDAKYKIDLINNILAAKELYLGKYYLDRKKWIPAINRFKTIVIKYDTSEVVEEAILRLIEVYYIIGLEEESKKYANILGYNYQSSEWYKYSYEIFNKKYTKSIKKKKKIDLLKKFRKLFD